MPLGVGVAAGVTLIFGVLNAIGWGQTIPKEPYIVDVKAADWGKILRIVI